MRTLVTIALVAVAGLHCSSPMSEEPVANDEPGVTEEPGPAVPVSGTKPAGGNDGTSEEDPRWGLKAEGLPPTVFTTTAHGDDGAVYMAGTYAGLLQLGSDTLRAKGGDDVVLARVERNGRITWIKSIGSSQQERDPKVTFSEGKVRILAQTGGEVDCGQGGMGRWNSEMFFYCLFDPEGTALGGGTFPTGAP